MSRRLLVDDRADLCSTVRCFRTRLDFELIRLARELDHLLDRAADTLLAGPLLGQDPSGRPAPRLAARRPAAPETPELT